jgi:DHA2 family multidrug resistance protein
VPRFLQGFAQGFIFVPLQTLALATIRLDRLSNATAAYNVVRNVGGSIGVAIITTLLARRAQYHQAILSERVTAWSPETAARLQQWADQFAQQGADSFTAARQATSMLYREMVEQAQILSYADEFWLLALVFMAVLPLLPLLRRVRAEENERARAAAPGRKAEPPPGQVGQVPDAID